MDLKPLLAEYAPSPAPRRARPKAGAAPVDALRAKLAGVTLGGGIYRVFSAEDAERWTEEAQNALPEFDGAIEVFAADWLGRFYAIGPERADGDVLLLEPGTMAGYEIPHDVRGLHESGIPDDPESILAASVYEAWRERSGDGEPLGLGECVGFTVPLFLGGADGVSNMERTDMEVYWSLTAQLWERAKEQAPGTKVGTVTSGDEKPKRRRWWWRT